MDSEQAAGIGRLFLSAEILKSYNSRHDVSVLLCSRHHFLLFLCLGPNSIQQSRAYASNGLE